MPASLLFDFDQATSKPMASSNTLEDSRAFELAYELSRLRMGHHSNGESSLGSSSNSNENLSSMFGSSSLMSASHGGGFGNHSHHLQILGPNEHHLHHHNNGLHGGFMNTNLDSESARLAAAKRSQNTTECVPVPSSEHVAEIVGRQGRQ